MQLSCLEWNRSLFNREWSPVFKLFNKMGCKPLGNPIVLITNESTKKVLLINS